MVYSFDGAVRCTHVEPATCHFRLFHRIQMHVNVGHSVSEGGFCFWQSTFNAVGVYDWKWCASLSEGLPEYDERTRDLLPGCSSSCWLGTLCPSVIVHSLNLGLQVCLVKLTAIQAHFLTISNKVVSFWRSDIFFCTEPACFSSSNCSSGDECLMQQ